MSLLLLYISCMEDDLQLIETFESDWWKNYVKREIFHKTRWKIEIDCSTYRGNNNFNFHPYSYNFYASFKIIETTYTMQCSHSMDNARQVGSKTLTHYIIQSFIQNIRKFEKTGEHLKEYENHVRKNSLTYFYPDLYYDNGDI